MKATDPKSVTTLRYSDIFLALYAPNGTTCLHRNHSHVLVYMYDGELEINERGRATQLHRGDCAFIRKDFCVQLTKQAYGATPFRAIFLMFTTPFLKTFYQRELREKPLPDGARRDAESLYLLPPRRPDIVSLFESMTPCFDSGVQPTEALLQLKMTEGLYVLLNTSPSLYASLFDFADPWKIDLLDFMETHYASNLTMQEIANYTGRSLATFKRDFKKISPLTPQQWLIHRRLEATHELLCSGRRRVTDVCFEVGFKNLSHFSRAYRRQFSHSPGGRP